MTDSGAVSGSGGSPEGPALTVRPAPHPPTPAPPPPPGPGVMPPFVAPPTDGADRRRWTAIGLAAAAVLVLCLAGAAGFGGLVYLGVQAAREQSQKVVEDYLTALRDGAYGQAYDLLCDPLQAKLTPDEFARDAPRISSFDVGEPSLMTADIEVPVQIRYASGDERTVRFVLYQDQTTGGFEVCGEAG